MLQEGQQHIEQLGNFLKMFGYSSLEDLPDLPRYRMDENQQIVIDDLIEEKKNEATNTQGDATVNNNESEINEAPMPEREENEELDSGEE